MIGGGREFQTNISKDAQWGYEFKHFKFSLADKANLKVLKSQPLHLELHKAYYVGSKMHSKVIGYSDIDLSMFAYINDYPKIEGYFHIFDKSKATDEITEMALHETLTTSLGQLWVEVRPNFNIKEWVDKHAA